MAYIRACATCSELNERFKADPNIEVRGAAYVASAAFSCARSSSSTPRPTATDMKVWPTDSSLRWRWLKSNEFDCDYGEACWGILVEATQGCPNGLYIELQVQDRDGIVVGYTNDVASSLRSGQKAKLLFETFDEGARSAMPTDMTCY